MQEGYIYYVDLNLATLNRMTLTGNNSTVLQSYYIRSTEGIALDWIGRYGLQFSIQSFDLLVISYRDRIAKTSLRMFMMSL